MAAASKEAQEIGRRIRELRGDMPQAELAILCGWRNRDGEPAQNRVSNYERGVRTLGHRDARLIATALGVGPEAILFGKEANGDPPPKSRDHVVLSAFRRLPEGLRAAIGDVIVKVSELRPPRPARASSATARRRQSR